MKSHFFRPSVAAFWLLLSGLFSSLFSQKTDTSALAVTTEIGELEEQELVQDYVFLTQKTAKYLLKVNLFRNGAGLERINSGHLIGYERKLGRAFSINLGGSIGGRAITGDSLSETSALALFSVTAEPRWYYRQARRIREGRSGNNLSDNYFSLLAQKTFVLTLLEGKSDLLERQQNFQIGAGWGIQRRIFRHGYFDLGAMATATMVGRTDPKWYFGLAPRVIFGLGFGPERYADSERGQCAALRCFVEENRQVRINLIEAFGFSNLPGNEFLSSKLSLESENRLGSGKRSVVLGLEAGGKRGEETLLEFENGILVGRDVPFEQAVFAASVELRDYYAMEKKIRRGEAARNFSGAFTCWRLQAEQRLRQERREVNGEQIWQNANSFKAQIGYGWGLQRRILEHGFFSVKGMPLVGVRENRDGWGVDFDFDFSIAFGLAF